MASNGTFVASDLPGIFYSPGQHDARLETGSGVWKLVTREGEQQVQLKFQKIRDWKENDLPFGTQLDVSRAWTAVNLFYFVGDPDQGERIDFEKTALP